MCSGKAQYASGITATQEPFGSRSREFWPAAGCPAEYSAQASLIGDDIAPSCIPGIRFETREDVTHYIFVAIGSQRE